MMLHYLPLFPETDGPRQRAVCARYIFPMEHSEHPTCPDCRAHLGIEPELTHDTAQYFLPPDFWTRPIQPCVSCHFGLARDGQTQCVSCQFKAANL